MHPDAAIQHGQEENIERKRESFPGNIDQIRSPPDTLKCSLYSLAVLTLPRFSFQQAYALYILKTLICTHTYAPLRSYTLKNAGLNMDKPIDLIFFNQQLG